MNLTFNYFPSISHCAPRVPPALNSRGRFWLGIAALKTAMKGILGFRFVPKDFNHGDCLSLERALINWVDKRLKLSKHPSIKGPFINEKSVFYGL